MARMTLDRLPPEIAAADNLPSPPTVALQVMRLAEDPHALAEDLGRVIRQDPALTARLLRTVNSAATGLPRSIDSIERACALLGFPTAKTIAIGFAVADSMPVVGPETGFDLEQYWMRSGLTASAAELFAREVSPDDAEVSFVVGLLSEMGRLVLAGCMTSVYKTILADDPWPSPADERAQLGFSNLDLSAALFTSWSLPEDIVGPIAHREFPDHIPEGNSATVVRQCRILATAEVLAGVWASGAAERDLNWAGGAAAHYLDLSPDAFVGVVEELRSKIESHEAFATVAPPAAVSVASIEERACAQLKQAVARSSTGSRVADMLRAAGA